ncbi:phosphatase domain-containing protein [Marinoscillum pacificum]|uniref:phosphatase domain-containing protein n=1 Tax=Marinoscillum pacificum TaxID=392723 RepID=UPI0021573A38|nr:App1 family protein [Marinoscillum pacificum]
MREIKPTLKVYKPVAGTNITYVMGHVLRSPVKKRDKITTNPFKNALEMIRRYRVKGMKNEEVQIELPDKIEVIQTDKNGYFETEIRGVTNQQIRISIPQFAISEQLDITVANKIEKIIVSDIDDTILVSHSTSLWRKLYLLLTKNHQRRKAFRGTEKFYHQLMGEGGQLFYVSSSEWNLYDFLNDFMNYNELPEGVLLLQDIKSGIRDLVKSGGGSHSHKKDKIERLLRVFPDVKFVLIGDSGQKDPYIYQSIVREYPGRVEEVYIRDVRKSKRDELEILYHSLKDHGVTLQVLTK